MLCFLELLTMTMHMFSTKKVDAGLAKSSGLPCAWCQSKTSAPFQIQLCVGVVIDFVLNKEKITIFRTGFEPGT